MYTRHRKAAQAVAVGAILLVVLFGSIPSPGAVLAQSSPPTVAVEDASFDESASVTVTLSKAPNGLSGFEIAVEVSDGSVVNITGASYPENFSLTEDPDRNDDGTRIRLKAADLNDDVKPGATAIELATVNVSAEGAGESDIRVAVLQLDNDTGGRIEATVDNGTLTVRGGTSTTQTDDADETSTTTDVSPESTATSTSTDTPTTTTSVPETTTTPTTAVTTTGAATPTPTATSTTTTQPGTTEGEPTGTTAGSTATGSGTLIEAGEGQTDTTVETPSTTTEGSGGIGSFVPVPGFGFTTAVMGLLLAGLLAWRRR